MIPSISIPWLVLAVSLFGFSSHVVFDKVKRSQPIALPREDASAMARAERLVMEYRKEQENKKSPKDPVALLRMRQMALYMDVVSLLLSSALLAWTVVHPSGGNAVQAVKLVLQTYISGLLVLKLLSAFYRRPRYHYELQIHCFLLLVFVSTWQLFQFYHGHVDMTRHCQVETLIQSLLLVMQGLIPSIPSDATIPLWTRLLTSADDRDMMDPTSQTSSSSSTVVDVEDDQKPLHPIRGRYAPIIISWLDLASEGFMSKHFRQRLQDEDIADMPKSAKPGHATMAYHEDVGYKNWSTMRKLFVHFRLHLFFQSIMAVIIGVSIIAQGKALELILKYLEARELVGDSSLRQGVLLALSLGGAKVISSVSELILRRSTTKMAARIRSILSFSGLSKILRLSNAIDEKNGSANESHIMDVFNIDLEHISRKGSEIAMVGIQSPVLVILATWSLFRLVGLATLGGIIVMIANALVHERLSAMNFSYYHHQRDLLDKRMSLTHEIITFIRWIKLGAYENMFAKKMSEMREAELKVVWRRQFVATVSWALGWSAVGLVSAATIATYTMLRMPITAPILFSVLVYCKVLTDNFSWLFVNISSYVFAFASLQRVDGLLALPDTTKYELQCKPDDEGQLVAENLTATWNSDGAFVLQDISVSFCKGLNVILGPVGAGKTCLFDTLLGETVRTSGRLQAPVPTTLNFEDGSARRIAYCPQDPVILSATARENITFGKSYDDARYHHALTQCCLDEDLASWRYGDQTLVGERGQLLSGGQKARLALARAIYSEADILLMDDILAAVDANTSRQLYQRVLASDILQTRTVLLVTHATWVANSAQQVILLSEGKITKAGTPTEVFGRPATIGSDSETSEVPAQAAYKVSKEQEEDPLEQSEVSKQEVDLTLAGRKYAAALGNWRVLSILVLLLVVAQSFNIGSTLFLRFWSDESHTSDTYTLLLTYLALVGATVLTETLRLLFITWRGLSASKKLSDSLTQKLMSCSVRVFDQTPVGRWSSRFSSDMYCVDISLPIGVSYSLVDSFYALSICLFVCYYLPVFTIFTACFLAAAWATALPFRNIAMRLRALSSASRSPLNSHIAEVFKGRTTFRAFGAVDWSLLKLARLLETQNLFTYNVELLSVWFTTRMNMAGAAFSAAVALYFVIESYDVGLAGFVLVLTMELFVRIHWATLHLSTLQLNLNAIERISDYCDNLQEEPQNQIAPPLNWPSKEASVQVQNLSVRYAPHLPAALKDVTFDIQAHERVAVVGRTGAGKSSLAMAFFRVLEANQGSIIIDGQDISQLDLKSLRSSLSIVSQDATLLKGTIRDNIDVESRHDDQTVWRALQAVGLAGETAKGRYRVVGLEDEVRESGINFSAGQKQLVALARVLLRLESCPFLILDEASAALDADADATIQRVIREEMKNATLLCIAHRLTTIGDFDRVLVLDKGAKVEFDKPANLLSNEKSMFYALAKSSGELKQLRKMAGLD